MLPMVKSIHFLALYAFLGAPVFWHLLWRPAVVTGGGTKVGGPGGTAGDVVQKRVRLGLVVSFLLFVVSGLAEALLAGSWHWPVFAKLGLVAVAGHCWRVTIEGAKRPPLEGPNRLFVAGGTVTSGALLVVMGFAGAGRESLDFFAVLNPILHLSASVVWVGGLLYGAALPWRTIRTEGESAPSGDRLLHGSLLGTLTERFGIVAFVGLIAVGLTGAFASYVHVYTPVALQKTTYGRTLAVKIALFLLVLAFGLLNYIVFSPRLRRSAGRGTGASFGTVISRVGSVLRVQGALFVGLLVASGFLASLPSGNVIHELMQQTWNLEVPGHSLTVNMASGDVTGELQFDLHLTDAAGAPAPAATEVVVDMEMPAHEMGLQPLKAEQIAPGHYRVKPLLSMDGDWHTRVTATFPDGEEVSTSFEFEAFQGARSAGMTRRFDFRAVFFEFREERAARAGTEGYVFDLGEYVRDFVYSLDPRPMYFVSGGFWFVAGLFVVGVGLRGGFPRWATAAGLIGLSIGAYFLFGATLVDAYPTTYEMNPVPFTAASVHKGRELYVANCSVCHGPEGHGDGPLAPYIDPPPEDLRVRHIDAHPDGELFWWFAKGIPGSEMPSTEDSMTDEERWHVVNFVRSLHRELPDDARQ